MISTAVGAATGTDFSRAVSSTLGPVLIVDDDPVNRQILRELCKQAGAGSILEAGDGEQALEMLAETKPDLVLLDIMMPRLNGIETCARIRADDRHTTMPVLIQTALADRRTRAKCFENGASDVVTKPLDLAEMRARVRVHLENQRLIRELEAFRERMDIHLALTAKLMDALLPPQHEIAAAEAATRHTIDVVHRTSEEIGGDLWSLRTHSDGWTLLLLTDAVGHGFAAAMNALRVDAVLRGIADMPPSQLLSELDRRLDALDKGQLTVAVTAIRIEHATGRLDICAAGAPTPLLIGANRIDEVSTGGLPLGSGLFTPRQARLTLESGQALLICSDGWQGGDAVRARSLLDSRASAIRTATASELANWADRTDDDLTLILLRRR
ncbi:fused response regulator/phosphatase [Constrictibacter sp. MBR-5]|jgi:sigma-B regulation protein RsbU (phosphoserine phosphatase)|uniref:fused response regulator/phosphatase n=1 Tax=Constrictibacter sp. MBR-5 TaxID=3156467 RepID=UPI00339813C8